MLWCSTRESEEVNCMKKLSVRRLESVKTSAVAAACAAA
jgi:hypothetical protein